MPAPIVSTVTHAHTKPVPSTITHAHMKRNPEGVPQVLDDDDHQTRISLNSRLRRTKIEGNLTVLFRAQAAAVDSGLLAPMLFGDHLPTHISLNTRLKREPVLLSRAQAAAFDSGLLAPMLFGDDHHTHTYVQDAEALAAPGEELSWWQLMVHSDLLTFENSRNTCRASLLAHFLVLSRHVTARGTRERVLPIGI